MKRFSEQFYTKAQSVKLQAVEREELRARVLSYMEYHPMESTVTQATKNTRGSEFRYIQLPFSSVVAKWSAVAAMFVLVAVPVLAEQSVPGDKLYAVKVRFNEEVISTLKLTPYQKVEWETERLNRRIAEARLLANEGKLTGEVEAEIAAAVQQHTESVEEGIEALRANDEDQAVLASIELNTTLQTQSDALQEGEGATLAMITMAKMAPETDSPTQKLADVINASLTRQMDPAAVPAYEKIMARVEVNTTRAHELLNSRNFSGDEKRRQAISRRLEDVERAIQQSNTLHEQNDAAASESLLAVLQRTKKIIVFLSDAGVRADIDTIVPIQYTNEELAQQVVDMGESINRKIETVTALNAKASAGTSEKTLYAIDIAKNNQQAIASSTDPAHSVYLAKESLAVLDDVLHILEEEGVTIDSIQTAPVEPNATTTPDTPVEETEEDN